MDYYYYPGSAHWICQLFSGFHSETVYGLYLQSCSLCTQNLCEGWNTAGQVLPSALLLTLHLRSNKLFKTCLVNEIRPLISHKL